MNSEAQSLEQIKERLLNLEKQNRRFKQAGVVALTVTTSLLLMGQASRPKSVQASQSNTVEASQFILKDKSGKARANLSIDESLGNSGTVQLVFFDGDGKQRVKLDSGVLASTGGELNLADEKGMNRIVISSRGRDLGGWISILDSKGFPVTYLSQTDGAVLPNLEATSVSLKDADGNTRARLFMTEKSTATAGELFPNMPPENKNLPVTFNPSPMLALYDLKGKARTILDGDGYIKAEFVGVADSQGNTLGSLSVLASYGAMLSLDNEKGEQRLLMEPGHLELSDDAGFKSSLGVTKDLVTARTGETHQTSAASLLLFDKNANVIWKAP